MLIRVLLVLLVVLNAGVAAWWIWHEPVPRMPAALPAGAPPLELLGQNAPATPSAASPVIAPSQCLRYGPFSNPRAFDAAREAIAPAVLWTATAEQPLSAPRAWRVLLPQPDRATAQATAARIGAAGFGDYLVLPEAGPDANAVALGRYRSEAAASERVAALGAAGFAARMEPVGGRSTLWLDVATEAGFPARSEALGLTGTPIDCARVVRDGRYTVDAPA